MLIAVNFHYIRPIFDAPFPGIHGMTAEQFESQLLELEKHGEFVSLSDVSSFVAGSPAPQRAICITFDDGLREQFEHAWPVLQKLGIPAIFFVNTAPLAEGKVLSVHKIHLLRSQIAPEKLLTFLSELAPQFGIEFDPRVYESVASEQYRYDEPDAACLKYLLNFALDWQQRDSLINACFAKVFSDDENRISRDMYMDISQLKVLAAQNCIGNHTHAHLPIGLLNYELAAQQIGVANQYLESWTGIRPRAMSYPYGSQNACTPASGKAASEQGIEFAFSMERAGNRDFSTPVFLARFDSNDVPGGKNWNGNAADFFQDLPVATWYRDSKQVQI